MARGAQRNLNSAQRKMKAAHLGCDTSRFFALWMFACMFFAHGVFACGARVALMQSWSERQAELLWSSTDKSNDACVMCAEKIRKKTICYFSWVSANCLSFNRFRNLCNRKKKINNSSARTQAKIITSKIGVYVIEYFSPARSTYLRAGNFFCVVFLDCIIT